MGTDTSLFGLILEASAIVQLVMLLLLAASVASWAIILRKRSLLREAMANSNAFEDSFWSGGDLTTIYRDITGSGEAPANMAGIFEAGFRVRLLARGSIARDRSARRKSCDARHHWFNQSLRGLVWHGVGHHAFFSRLG